MRKKANRLVLFSKYIKYDEFVTNLYQYKIFNIEHTIAYNITIIMVIYNIFEAIFGDNFKAKTLLHSMKGIIEFVIPFVIP